MNCFNRVSECHEWPVLRFHLGLPPSPVHIHTQRALDETVIGGVPTTIGYHKLILATEDFVKGDVDTGFIPSHAEGV